jgi:hypothetical protein
MKEKVSDDHSKVGYRTYREASRFRSEMGESIPPTPSAAFPRRGKKPCKPRIAVAWMSIESCVADNWRWNTRSNTPGRLPRLFVICREVNAEGGGNSWHLEQNVQLVKLIQIWERNECTGCGGWEMKGYTLVLSSNLPLGVSIKIDGGRNGYSEGSRMRKW